MAHVWMMWLKYAGAVGKWVSKVCGVMGDYVGCGGLLSM